MNLNQNQENMTQTESDSKEKKSVSITEAAKINGVTRQAIYVAIKHKKLKAVKETTQWVIQVEDLEEYSKHKYSRTKSLYEGKLLFDNEAGYFSVGQVAKMLGVPAQKIYYATRIGRLSAHRKGAAWVIHKDDVEAFKNSFMENKGAQAS